MPSNIFIVLLVAMNLFSGCLFADGLQIPHFVKVNDGISRGGRPPLEDVKTLATLGYKTIIDLEDNVAAVKAEKEVAVKAGLQFLSFPTGSWETPSDKAVNEILGLLQDAHNFPIFLHCEHGQDRTGLIMGLYRFSVDKWTAQKAYDEMKQLGFHSILYKLDQYYKQRTGLGGARLSGVLVRAMPKGKHFDRAVFVIFENENYTSVITQPFFKQLADRGAHLSNMLAVTHPSQGNYVALTSGALNGVTGDGTYNLTNNNVVDLLEAKGLTWKVYAEDYPGSCFTGKTSANYARKHNPFISYLNIQRNSARCANIVNANQFDQDATKGSLPNYVFYVPNLKNDGHDTGVAYADKWYSGHFSRYVNDSQFMQNTILISTFDESGFGAKNQIYTSIVGPAVTPTVVSQALNLYSLLRLIEENWDLGSLAQGDANAPVIANIWH